MKRSLFMLAVVILAVITIVTVNPSTPVKATEKQLMPGLFAFYQDIAASLESCDELKFRVQMVATARSYIGKIEYDLIGDGSDLKAGKSDCSGFVWQIYKTVGAMSSYKKYRTCAGTMEAASSTSSAFIYEISADEALPGDLVVYENSKKYQEENPGAVYGHMGLYTGRGLSTVIHVTRNDHGYTGCVETPVNYRNIPEDRIHYIRIDLTETMNEISAISSIRLF